MFVEEHYGIHVRYQYGKYIGTCGLKVAASDDLDRVYVDLGTYVTIGDEQVRIAGKIGRGAFGKVHKVYSADNVAMAAKAIKVGHTMNPLVGPTRIISHARAQDEVDTQLAIDSPHIGEIYAASEPHQVHTPGMEDIYWILMPLYELTLAQLIPLEEPHALNVLLQLARGVDAIASNGFSHRDLKPTNVMLHDGVVKVVDFGLASTNCIADTRRGGTPKYMAPEVRRRDAREVNSCAADIWSLGIIAHEILGGRVTRKGELVDMPPYVSQEMRNLISDMLIADPISRPTAADVVHECERLASP